MSQSYVDYGRRGENPTLSVAVTIFFMGMGLLGTLAFLIAPSTAHESENPRKAVYATSGALPE